MYDRRIAIIIVLYFSISLTNVALKQEVEWFPLFSFKLFSRIPGDFVKYDIVFDKGTSNEHYLLYRNNQLTGLERRNYEHWLTKGADQSFKTDGYEYLFDNATSASLVKISGSF